jgi:hypothetical protein
MGEEGEYTRLLPGLTLIESGEVYPCHIWDYYDMDGSDLITTSAFKSLPISERLDVFAKLNIFFNQTDDPSKYGMGTRIESGNEAIIFTFGPSQVIKLFKSGNHEYLDYPTRMLNNVALQEHVHTHLPGWVGVVPDYLYFNGDGIDFSILPRIGNGITIYDLRKRVSGAGGRSTFIGDSIDQDFPYLDRHHLNVLLEQFDRTKKMLKPIVDRDYDEIPTVQDFGMSNVLVTPLQKPIDCYPFKLWIIDQ